MVLFFNSSRCCFAEGVGFWKNLLTWHYFLTLVAVALLKGWVLEKSACSHRALFVKSRYRCLSEGVHFGLAAQN
jgi:hypothetical protein